MIASEYVRSPKSFRSIIGSALLRSQKMNAASAAARDHEQREDLP
jgi:hypothetical protein